MARGREVRALSSRALRRSPARPGAVQPPSSASPARCAASVLLDVPHVLVRGHPLLRALLRGKAALCAARSDRTPGGEEERNAATDRTPLPGILASYFPFRDLSICDLSICVRQLICYRRLIFQLYGRKIMCSS